LPAGEFSRARAHLKEALALYDPREHKSPSFVYAFDPRVVCLDYLARALLPLGFPDQALAANDEAVAEAHRVDHRNSLALPLFFGAVIHQILGDHEGVQKRCTELARIAGEAGFRFWHAGATILNAWTIAEAGNTDRGRVELQQGLGEWLATGAKYMVPYFHALQAQIEVKAGDPNAAVRLLEAAYADIERTNERWFAAEVLRLHGEVLRQLGQDFLSLSKDRLSDALATARAQGARFWELRAALSLAQVDRPDSHAREELSVIYSGFTEGLDLPEMQAAKILALPVGALAH
jgi:predicted ATPase